MNLKETIRHILKEETSIPLVIRRRASFEQIEEAFDDALERMGGSMNNPDSIIYKEKGTTLRTFAKFVIDEMVTYLEQDYFNDDNRIYFDSDEYYYNEIRKPLLKYYEKRIKEKFDEVTSDGINESFLKEETIKKFNKNQSERGELSDILENLAIDYIGEENICDIFVLYASGTYVVMVLYNGQSKWDLSSKLDTYLKSYIPVRLFSMITDTKCN